MITYIKKGGMPFGGGKKGEGKTQSPWGDFTVFFWGSWIFAD